MTPNLVVMRSIRTFGAKMQVSYSWLLHYLAKVDTRVQIPLLAPSGRRNCSTQLMLVIGVTDARRPVYVVHSVTAARQSVAL